MLNSSESLRRYPNKITIGHLTDGTFACLDDTDRVVHLRNWSKTAECITLYLFLRQGLIDIPLLKDANMYSVPRR